MTGLMRRIAARALAALAPFLLALALATPSHATLSIDYACSENFTHGVGSFYESGATTRDHRRAGGNAQGQAKHMAADNFASRWGGWSAYYRSWPTDVNRLASNKVACFVAYEVAWIDAYTLARIEVTGADDGLHGYTSSIIVTDEWDYTSSTGKFNGRYRSADWNACAGDEFCNTAAP